MRRQKEFRKYKQRVLLGYMKTLTKPHNNILKNAKLNFIVGENEQRLNKVIQMEERKQLLTLFVKQYYLKKLLKHLEKDTFNKATQAKMKKLISFLKDEEDLIEERIETQEDIVEIQEDIDEQ